MLINDDALVAIIAELDDETFEHSRRVQSLALTLGKRMGLLSTELTQLGQGAFLHDIGKKFVPDRILRKKTALTHEEWQIIKMHPKFGYECAEAIGLSDTVKGIILGHHQWADGQGGYPQGAGLSKPCLLTQITTVADVVDAMTSNRPYRQALSMPSCIEYLEENAGTMFNREVVHILRAEIRQLSRKAH